jgi:hypothetical protein
VPKSQSALVEVFLNVPYDKKFEKLFLAYICGTASLGLTPRTTLEIRKSSDRLDKLLNLIRSCQYSIHDLSRVQLDQSAPRTPRFNMPFELGLAVAWSRISKNDEHQWFVCESVNHRLQKSLSDLNGVDPKIHGGRVGDVFVELRNMFTRPGRQPSVQQMWAIYREVRRRLSSILRQAGANSLYNFSVFRELYLTARASTDKVLSQPAKASP